MSGNIAVIDVETTGLDARVDHLLEVACAIIDSDYNTLHEYQAVIWYPNSEVAKMRGQAAPLVVDMHTKTGLWTKLNHGKFGGQVDLELCAILSKYNVPGQLRMPIGGNSVALDQSFLRAHLPSSFQQLDYHMRDVSSIAAFAQESFGIPRLEKVNDHTAMTDVHECIRELRYYRDMIRELTVSQRELAELKDEFLQVLITIEGASPTHAVAAQVAAAQARRALGR